MLMTLYPNIMLTLVIHPYRRLFFDAKYGNIMEFFQEINSHAYARGVNGFIETDKCYVVVYIYDKCQHLAVISKHDEHTNDATIIIEDTQLGGFPINLVDFPPISISENCMVIALEPSLIKAYANTLPTEQRVSVMSRITNVSDEQNPVVLKIKFK